MDILNNNDCMPHVPQSDYIWKISFGLAVGLHLLTLVVAFFAPSLFPRRSFLPEVYTVDLFNVAEIHQKAQPKAVSRPAPQTKTAPRSVQEMPPPPLQSTKAISINPLKSKALKTPTKIDENKMNLAIDRVRARIREKEAQDKAERLKQEALEKIRASYRSSVKTSATEPVTMPIPPVEDIAPVGDTVPETSSGTRPMVGNAVDLEMSGVLRRYYAAIMAHIQKYWVLPTMQDWHKDLEAILVITIQRDGTVTDTFFESRSTNDFFNQFVQKTMRAATPLPAFPEDLEESSIEIGLRFHPTEDL